MTRTFAIPAMVEERKRVERKLGIFLISGSPFLRSRDTKKRPGRHFGMHEVQQHVSILKSHANRLKSCQTQYVEWSSVSEERQLRTFTIPVSPEDEKKVEQEIRDFVRQWVGLLADRKYSAALDLLSPEVPPGSGTVDSRKTPQWTPSLLEAVIANYGMPEPLPDLPPLQPEPFAVVPLDSSLLEVFEANLSIDFDRGAISNLDRAPISPQKEQPQEDKRIGWLSAKLSLLGRSKAAARARNTWLGGTDFALPLNLERGNDLSDLSARMRFKPLTNSEMAMVLLDIHVL